MSADTPLETTAFNTSPARIAGVAGLLQHTADIWPDSPSVSFAGDTFTWRQTARRCRNLAGAFQRLGVSQGARIAYLGFNSLPYFEQFFAPAFIGAFLVPVNFRLSLREMIECLEDAQPVVLIADDDHLDQAAALAQACPALQTLIHAGQQSTPAGMLNYEELAVTDAQTLTGTPGEDDETAVLFYTGGTTGRAKGVMLSHANLLANAQGTAPLYDMQEREAYLLASPMFHAAAGSRIYTATLTGSHTVILSRFDTRQVIETIERYRINCVQLVPTMIQMILDHPRLNDYDLSSLRMISYGAAPMPVTLLQETLSRFPDIRFYQAYGMTETSPVIAMLRAEDHQLTGDYLTRLSSVGRPVPHVAIQVVDENDQALPTGETGEIVVRGANVMGGYWRAPKLTETALKGGWYHTGDGGYFNHDGYLVLAGRIKDMIVSGGENIYPIEIENLLYRYPAIRECAVIGVPHEKWGEAVHAVVRLHEGQHVTEADLISYCREHIAHYKCPVGVTFRDTPMPLSSVNKILKTELKKAFLQ